MLLSRADFVNLNVSVESRWLAVLTRHVGDCDPGCTGCTSERWPRVFDYWWLVEAVDDRRVDTDRVAHDYERERACTMPRRRRYVEGASLVDDVRWWLLTETVVDGG